MTGQVILVTQVGAASGPRAAAAALACAGSEQDRAGLLVDLTDSRPPRPSLIATASARRLEERLAAHVPEGRVASRGLTCHLALPSDPDALDSIGAALPLVRDSVGVVHLPPRLLQPALAHHSLRPTAALLRADLREDRALTALAVRDLIEAGIRVAVLKQQPGWMAARRALAGIDGLGGGTGLPRRPFDRLLGP